MKKQNEIMNYVHASEMTDASIRETATTILNTSINDVDFSSMSSKDIAMIIATLSVYREMLDKKFNDTLSGYLDKLNTPNDYNNTISVGSHKVVLAMKDSIDAKAIKLTNAGLKSKYNIADSIISEDTKTIVTLHKDQLLAAKQAGISEVIDAIANGDLVCEETKSKTISVKLSK